MHPQQHLYNGLAQLPGLRTIPVLHGNGFARLWASPCWHRNGLARTDSVLAYGHCGWLPMASTAHLRPARFDVGTGRTTGQGAWKDNTRTKGYAVGS